MRTTLTLPRFAVRGLDPEPDPRAASTMDGDVGLTDDELEAVVGGLARVRLPVIRISAAQAPA